LQATEISKLQLIIALRRLNLADNNQTDIRNLNFIATRSFCDEEKLT